MKTLVDLVKSAVCLGLLIAVCYGSVTACSQRQIKPDHVFAAPSSAPSDSIPSIYFLLRRESSRQDQSGGTVQIWEVSTDPAISWPLSEFPIRYPISALPAQELAILEHNSPTDPETDPFDGAYLNYGIGDLELSPDRQMLAWVDGAGWCPNTTCYGFQRILTWDLTNGESRILFELPIHIDLRTTQAIGDIAWSPDGRQIGFVQSSNDKGWSRVRVVDANTGQIDDIGEGRAPLTWAPNGESIALVSYSWDNVHIVSRGGNIRAVLEAGWSRVEGIDWSPDGSRIAIAAAVGSDKSTRQHLFIAYSNTWDIAELNTSPNELLNYSQPHWSPGGEMIGVNTRLSGEGLVSGLMVLDPSKGTVEANLELERYYPDWSWSANGTAVLVQLGSSISALPPHTPQGVGVFYWMEENFEQVLLPSDVEDGLDSWQLYLSEPVW